LYWTACNTLRCCLFDSRRCRRIKKERLAKRASVTSATLMLILALSPGVSGLEGAGEFVGEMLAVKVREDIA
jgi:hypothetical protein